MFNSTGENAGVLLTEFRNQISGLIDGWESIPSEAEWILSLIERDPTMASRSYWGDYILQAEPTAEEISHYTRVLQRLAALS